MNPIWYALVWVAALGAFGLVVWAIGSVAHAVRQARTVRWRQTRSSG